MVLPAETIILIHQFIIYLGYRSHKSAFQIFCVHTLPTVYDHSRIITFGMSQKFLIYYSIFMRRKCNFLIMFRLLFNLYTIINQNSFHDLAQSLPYQICIINNHPSQLIYYQKLFLYLLDEHLVIALDFCNASRKVCQYLTYFRSQVLHLFGSIEQSLTLLDNSLELSLTKLLFFICKCLFYLFIKLPTFSIILVSQLHFQFLTIFIKPFDHFSLK